MAAIRGFIGGARYVSHSDLAPTFLRVRAIAGEAMPVVALFWTDESTTQTHLLAPIISSNSNTTSHLRTPEAT